MARRNLHVEDLNCKLNKQGAEKNSGFTFGVDQPCNEYNNGVSPDAAHVILNRTSNLLLVVLQAWLIINGTYPGVSILLVRQDALVF